MSQEITYSPAVSLWIQVYVEALRKGVSDAARAAEIADEASEQFLKRFPVPVAPAKLIQPGECTVARHIPKEGMGGPCKCGRTTVFNDV